VHWVTMERRIGTGVFDDCRLASEPLEISDVAPSDQILGAALIFLRVMLFVHSPLCSKSREVCLLGW
jgi:hypothetical protein